MTYGEIYNQALEELCLFPGEVEDYRPAVEMHIKQLKEPIPNGIIIWLKNGDKIIYVADSQKEEQDPILDEEQELILDKVKAEMKEEVISHSGTGEEVTQAYADGLKRGLEIIDKYKAKSEEINGR